jgi:hypothetical protein
LAARSVVKPTWHRKLSLSVFEQLGDRRRSSELSDDVLQEELKI